MNELYDLNPNEVSLVDEGANRKKFLVFKSREGNKMQPTDSVKNLMAALDTKTMGKVDKVLKSMKVKKDDGTEGDLSDRAQAALRACARILAPFADEIDDSHMDQMQDEIGMDDGDDDEDSDEAEAEGDPVAMGKSIPQKVKNEDEIDEDPEEDDVEKKNVNKSAVDLSAFPVEQRGQLEAVFKSNQLLVEQNKTLVEKSAKLEKEIADRTAKEKEQEYVAKAAELKGCGIPQEELVTVLKNAATVSKENYELICKSFATTAKQVEQSGLFKEIGSRQSASKCTAEQELDRLVESCVAKADGKVSKAALYDQVLQTPEGKDLYKKIKASRPGGI